MTIETIEQTTTNTVVTHLPRWHVVLLNTEHHTFHWVITLIMTVFNKDFDEAYALTMEIHERGRCIAATTHKEKAEMLKDLVRGFGIDPESSGPKEPLPCELESAE
jgi:ATP-dependent Clp protease adapter protein ClpS